MLTGSFECWEDQSKGVRETCWESDFYRVKRHAWTQGWWERLGGDRKLTWMGVGLVCSRARRKGMWHVDGERRVLEKNRTEEVRSQGGEGQALEGVRQKIETYYYRRVVF